MAVGPCTRSAKFLVVGSLPRQVSLLVEAESLGYPSLAGLLLFPVDSLCRARMAGKLQPGDSREEAKQCSNSLPGVLSTQAGWI